MTRRRARLRPEYADWYPQIWAGEWHDALWVTEIVRRQLREGSPTWFQGPRILSDRHFQFEGGDYGARSRPTLERRRAITQG
jgi:hypothetical protein